MTTELPSGLQYVRTTQTLTEIEHPAGILRAHRVARDVWAVLRVQTGELCFVFEDENHSRRISTGMSVVIPPERPHHVEFVGPVEFTLEFHRRIDGPPPPAGEESSGLR